MNDHTDADIIEGEAREVALSDVDSSLAAALAGVEINQQIATARRFPRQLKVVTDRIFNLATLDAESAAENMFVLPRAGKPIAGPSIRFAEILQQSFGNCRAAARVVLVDRVDMFVEAEGVFHDLETNSATSARVRRSIRSREGRCFTEDMIIVTGNAACSIAKRNAILGGVPKPLWRGAYEAVQQTVRGDMKTLVERRSEAIKSFAQFGVTADQVFQALGVAGAEDVMLEHIPLLRGMFATIKNGEATVEEMFATPLSRGPGQPATNTDLKQRLKDARAAQGGDGAEGFNSTQQDHAPAQADPLPDDEIPREGGGTSTTPAAADSGENREEPAKSGEIRQDPPRTLVQRIAAFKTLVDAAPDIPAVLALKNENAKLWADVDAGDPDEHGTVDELDEYCGGRIAAIDRAAS